MLKWYLKENKALYHDNSPPGIPTFLLQPAPPGDDGNGPNRDHQCSAFSKTPMATHFARWLLDLFHLQP